MERNIFTFFVPKAYSALYPAFSADVGTDMAARCSKGLHCHFWYLFLSNKINQVKAVSLLQGFA